MFYENWIQPLNYMPLLEHYFKCMLNIYCMTFLSTRKNKEWSYVFEQHKCRITAMAFVNSRVKYISKLPRYLKVWRVYPLSIIALKCKPILQSKCISLHNIAPTFFIPNIFPRLVVFFSPWIFQAIHVLEFHTQPCNTYSSQF